MLLAEARIATLERDDAYGLIENGAIAVRGGQIAGDWPGLRPRDLFEGRDLRALNSYEALFKAILIGHLGLDPDVVETDIFPGSAARRPMLGVLKAL